MPNLLIDSSVFSGVDARLGAASAPTVTSCLGAGSWGSSAVAAAFDVVEATIGRAAAALTENTETLRADTASVIGGITDVDAALVGALS
ncbi:hypothetical protein [Diaminobutyricimonas sp. LJ205]|uniref:hypothetical protein n=1 Tax=Diaminobutyricimonas sp. LJ205 TaxID=2683590 RepID=UPI0012F4FA10|nr:hypothetical protein [Diaminobutyricimonas sp. LJ205]